MRSITLDSPAKTITSALTQLFVAQLNGVGQKLSVELSNTGSTALNALTIEAKESEAGDWGPISSTGDFAAAIPGTMPRVDTVNNPSSLGAGLTSSFDLIVTGSPVAIRGRASVASGSTTIVTFGTATLGT